MTKISFSTAKSATAFKSSLVETIPVGLEGLVKISAFVFGVYASNISC